MEVNKAIEIPGAVMRRGLSKGGPQMWVFTLTEEHSSVNEAHHYFGTYVDREPGKQFALHALSSIMLAVKAGAMTGADFCFAMAEKVFEDGDRLNVSTEGGWSGEASECDGDHKRGRRLTYWLKEMSEAEAEETRGLFTEQFGESISFEKFIPGTTAPVPELQPA